VAQALLEDVHGQSVGHIKYSLRQSKTGIHHLWGEVQLWPQCYPLQHVGDVLVDLKTVFQQSKLCSIKWYDCHEIGILISTMVISVPV
jgi:hypothetical protein